MAHTLREIGSTVYLTASFRYAYCTLDTIHNTMDAIEVVVLLAVVVDRETDDWKSQGKQ